MKKQTRNTLLFLIGLAGLATAFVWIMIRFFYVPPPGETVADMGNRHLTSTTDPHEAYNTIPPTSGPHVGGIARWGIHREQIPDEQQIHNLEDGGVIIHYDPTRTDPETVARMESMTRAEGEHVILEPYAGLSHPIVLTAWARIYRLDAFDEDGMRTFISRYKGIDHHRR